MDFWKRTCSDLANKEYKTKEQIFEWKNNSIKLLESSDCDFVLLQEINPWFLYCKEYTKNKFIPDFKIGNKNIYYHELLYNLSQELYDPKKNNYWGVAIIANEKYILSNKYFFEIKLEYKFYDKYNKSRILKSYYGNETLICYDFEIEKKIITVINLYNKCIYTESEYEPGKNHWDYYQTMENLIQGISSLIHDKTNLIILAGDFNGSIEPTKDYPDGNKKYIKLFGDINKLGFKNCTKDIGTTVDSEDHPYQNDYIFIKNYNGNSIDLPKKYLDKNISDHYRITCEIKM